MGRTASGRLPANERGDSLFVRRAVDVDRATHFENGALRRAIRSRRRTACAVGRSHLPDVKSTFHEEIWARRVSMATPLYLVPGGKTGKLAAEP